MPNGAPRRWLLRAYGITVSAIHNLRRSSTLSTTVIDDPNAFGSQIDFCAEASATAPKGLGVRGTFLPLPRIAEHKVLQSIECTARSTRPSQSLIYCRHGKIRSHTPLLRQRWKWPYTVSHVS
ncbi:MAG: hypothetical protein AAGF95_30840 [Chloroflexota bacterium]